MTKGRLGCCGRLPSTMVDEEKEVHYYVSEYCVYSVALNKRAYHGVCRVALGVSSQPLQPSSAYRKLLYSSLLQTTIYIQFSFTINIQNIDIQRFHN